LSQKEIEDKFDEIAGFADIEILSTSLRKLPAGCLSAWHLQ